MPQSNRYKLHLELRLKARALEALRRDERLAREAEEERLRRAIARAIARSSTATATITEGPGARLRGAWAGVSSLLHLAGVGRDVRDRVRRLLLVLDRQIPTLCCVEQLPWLLLLGGERWVRPLEAFVATHGSTAERKDALALHLLARWPVPEFLLRGLDVRPLAVARVPIEDRWAVAALATVGRGGSLFDLAGTDALATPLTRRMCHLFLSAPPTWTPIRALRTAQVVGSGGSPDLADRLLGTLLGVYRGDHPWIGEGFWQRVIGWAVERKWLQTLDRETLGAVLRWIEAEQWASASRGEPLSLSGRTRASLLRAVDTATALRTADARARFPSSGIPAWTEDGWAVVELASPSDLVAEAAAMHHCVANYDQLAASGKVALFSLRFRGQRRVTLEVVLSSRRVVQAKGACNRPVTEEELVALSRWADAAWVGVEPIAVGR